MKRTGNLYPEICDFENLHTAWRKAARGKRKRPDVMTFEADLEKNLHAIRRKLLRKTWRASGYRTFTIYDDKPRLIAAAPFKDRVVHHALINVLEPVFEPTFIFDLYSNRKGKGTHDGVRRAQAFAEKWPYVIHADVRHYFSSIDIKVLLNLIARKVKCVNTLDLVARIVDIKQPEIAAGLPLGNQTSQFFANIYLNPLDHYIKESLRVKGYLRYVDDMWLFGSDKSLLLAWKEAISCRLQDLRLKFKHNGVTIYRVEDSFPCLGYRVFPWTVLVRRKTVLRFRRNVKRLKRDYSRNRISLTGIRCSLMGSMGHISQASSENLCLTLMRESVFTRPLSRE